MSKKTMLILAVVLTLAAYLYTLVSEVRPAQPTAPSTVEASQTAE